MRKLTTRELQVLEGLINGLTNESIAGNLFISKDTVKVCLKRVYEKLEVTNRVSAAVKAITCGIVEYNNIQ